TPHHPVIPVLDKILTPNLHQIRVLIHIQPLPDGDAGLIRRLESHPGVRAVPLSALTGEGMGRLLATIDELLPLDPLVHTTLRITASDGATLALLHEFGRVIGTHYTDDICEVEAEIPESLNRRLAARR